MRVLIVSDTHGNAYNFNKVIEANGVPDMVIHLGDAEGREYYLKELAPCPFELVAGNSDENTNLPEEKVIELAGKKIWLTHGHLHCVTWKLDYLVEKAEEMGVDMVMFGHTHMPMLELEAYGIPLINPGSLTNPRQPDKRPSYIYMDIDEKNEIEFSLEYL